MKRFLITMFMLIAIWGNKSYAKYIPTPIIDTEISRYVTLLEADGKRMNNVLVKLEAISPDNFITATYRVKITVVDSSGEVVYKETLKDVFLYLLTDDGITVSKGKIVKLYISKRDKYGRCVGIIDKKQGMSKKIL